MIKSVDLMPFTKSNPLPTYARWQGLEIYTVKAKINGGYEREFMAVTGAMAEAGIIFDAIDPSCPVEDLMTEIGGWYKGGNSDIQEIEITLQKQ